MSLPRRSGHCTGAARPTTEASSPYGLAPAGTAVKAPSAEAHTAMSTTITEDLEGKNVVNAAGDTVGIVTAVENGQVYVDPDPGIATEIKVRLGLGSPDERDYSIDPDSIQTVRANAIELRGG